MVHVDAGDPHRDCIHLPRSAVRFPVEWRAPEAFHAEDPAAWPRLEGRLELVGGRIQYMPPCGEQQQEIASDVTSLLHDWVRSHPQYVVGSNEAGMLLDGEVRGADAAVWRRADVGSSKGFRRAPPVLAVEIAGEHEDEEALREKALWYLARGVFVVWIVLADEREVLVLSSGAESRHAKGESLPPNAALPDLVISVDAIFFQIDRR